MRDLLEGMTRGIRNFSIEPLSVKGEDTGNTIDEFDEPLRIGSKVFAPDHVGDKL